MKKHRVESQVNEVISGYEIFFQFLFSNAKMREKKSSLISGKLYHITDEKLCSQRQDEITEQTYDGANIVRSIKYCR